MESRLPIEDIIPEIQKKLRDENTLILQAPPGAGKSTLLPLRLLDEAWLKGQKILMLEPRRLAARSVAQRMADILNENISETVGYRVRFDNKIGKSTRLEVLTEGILTRIIQQDNSLEGVGMVIFDEFHERSLHADLALALCREVQQVLRNDLRILIMSATLDGEKISAVLGNAPIITSKGRQYPVEYIYLPQDEKLSLPKRIAAAIKKAYSSQEGDILAFLPGAGEINKAEDILKEEIAAASIHPLFGDLSQLKQQEAITPNSHGRRKIVLSTSIAETSLTIEGIKVVVDSGLSRIPKFDPRSGLSRLETVKVTKDSADQRAGRAGRLGPGVCYRLWSEGSNQHLLESRTPEILEADLAPTILELFCWGVKDINLISWLTPPPSGSVAQAKALLTVLGAVKDDTVTEKGRKMTVLPTHPRIANLLLFAQENHMIALGTDIAAIIEERDPLSKDEGANLLLRIEALRAYRKKQRINGDRFSLDKIERLACAWRNSFKIKEDNEVPAADQVGKLLAAAYPDRIARKREKDSIRYKLAGGRTVMLKDHDPLAVEDWLVIAQADSGINEGRVFLAAPVNYHDLDFLVSEVENVSWDFQKGMLIAQKQRRIGEIIAGYSPLPNIPEELKISVLLEVIQKEGLAVLSWTDEVIDLQARVCSLRLWRPEENWPDVSKAGLSESIADWLPPYLGQVNKKEDFKKIDLYNVLLALLPYELSRKLESLAPGKIQVPSGSMIELKYKEDGAFPVLAVRLQEMFGLLDTPTINEGRVKVLLHLLSPGYKPVQVTQDLKSFWKNTYPDVRKELRVRYQKHHWPEDPWTAEAVRGAKRRNN